MRYRHLFMFLLVIGCGENHIVQRAADDYFPLREGYWWRYAGENDTVLVEVEPKDTLLEIECFPVSYNGMPKYLAKHAGSISQYVIRTHNVAGDDYTIIEDFVVRIELPLVVGNTHHHVLADSVSVAGHSIQARHEFIGQVVGYDFESAYGDVYEVSITTIRSFSIDGTALADTGEVTEYYAPGVGMVRFRDGTAEYELIVYNIP
ncbi:hypothetical protein IBX73_04870 [candidate division WOR-3 bacterium]|nr:hypothetical protein [candidate division WOR-3 bacterium]